MTNMRNGCLANASTTNANMPLPNTPMVESPDREEGATMHQELGEYPPQEWGAPDKDLKRERPLEARGRFHFPSQRGATGCRRPLSASLASALLQQLPSSRRPLSRFLA